MNYKKMTKQLQLGWDPQLQSVAKYLRLTLIFMWNSAPPKKLIAIFWVISASTNKFFILAGGMGTGLSFFEV